MAGACGGLEVTGTGFPQECDCVFENSHPCYWEQQVVETQSGRRQPSQKTFGLGKIYINQTTGSRSDLGHILR